MKKFFFYLISTLLIAGLLAACSDDDNKDTTDYAPLAAGVFDGTLTVSVDDRTINDVEIPGFDITYNHRVRISVAGKNLLKLEMTDIQYLWEDEMVNIGDITVPAIMISVTPGGSYSFLRSETYILFERPVSARDVETSGHITADGAISINFGIIGAAPYLERAITGPTGITMRFTGTRRSDTRQLYGKIL